ncbi:unnamed protein product [Porites lobata]|uniref:Uncharacterized protein n=1 Tax=Porites lobata TaxID=104759 RepID=A0ABN8PAJ8_9CNID|nr:unnamed protein product [Porites lobata]
MPPVVWYGYFLESPNGPHHHYTTVLLYLAQVDKAFSVKLMEYNQFEAGKGKTVLDTHFTRVSHKTVRWLNPCNASIIEWSASFHFDSNAHNLAAEVGTTLAASITAKVKPKAAVDIFRPASAIVEEVLLEDLTDDTCPCFPKWEYIAQVASRHQQCLRPQDPTDLNFNVEEDHIPDGFLQGDIQVCRCRHLMFATDQQL